MRLFLALVVAFTLTGCAAESEVSVTPNKTQSPSSEETQTMDPMDPMESETAEPTATEEADESPSPTASATRSPAATASPSPTATQTQSGYTLADVAKRNTPAECWVAIDGNVYDLTGWISQHPGGSGSIRSMCGTDGTNQFLSQHGGESRPSAALDRYLLGPLLG
ncbi:MAG: hypothetical protein F2536_02165 [Actinobacteria bacterium]|nr:hypothetical protein [Actinomycetota bacterium]MTA89716.1 hypothetical protein [Actinomycetota bacterium]